MSRNITVAYVTDIEGQWERLVGFCADNPYVHLGGDCLIVAPGAVFVFGGDAIDRGPHGRRIVATLLQAKRRQPNQVVLLAGNRDLNKIRLIRELRGVLPRKATAAMVGTARPELLRWIFANTMGATGAFEHYATELAEQNVLSRPDSETSASERQEYEEALVDQYLADLDPGGLLWAYLSVCQLGYVANGTLFVHGGVTEETLGAIPGSPNRTPKEVDVHEWIQTLNGWYALQIGLFCSYLLDVSCEPPYLPLIQYQGPLSGQKTNPGSVIYNRHGDHQNNACLPPDSVMCALRDQGIFRLIVGHTPSGDAPSILRAPGFDFVIADNSRGTVSTGSQVFVKSDQAEIVGRAQLGDGSVVQVNAVLPTNTNNPSPLGKRLADSGHLITAQQADGDWLLFRYLEQFAVDQQMMANIEVQRRSFVIPHNTL